MDPQTQALIQALAGGQQGAGPGALSPFAPGAMAGANQQAYALPQDPMAMQPMQPGAPPPGGAGQNASMGDQGGLSLGTGQQQPNMYGAMMTPPPATNYWQ